MAGDEVPWPQAPREPGPWTGGPPVAPPGNTPLPPLPGQSGVVHNATATVNPWSATGPAQPLPVPGGPAPFPGLPPGGRVKADRAPGWVLVLALLVVLAVVAGGAYAVISSRETFPSAWDERVGPIAEWVAKERKLDFDHPVEVEFLDAAAYTEASGGGEATVEPTADDAAESEAQLGQLRALGLLSGAPDLDAAGRSLSDGGTLAFYSYETHRVYVRGTEMTPALRVTLAHELTHVLQDQNFDLDRIQDLPSGTATTYRALAEGDATRVEEAYAAEELTDPERVAYAQDMQKASEEAGSEVYDKIPPVLTTFFQAPYILGPRLVSYLEDAGSEKIDLAFQEPPTEEVLFDPLAFDTPEAEAVDVTVEAPAGTEVDPDDEPDEFGPVALYVVLAARIDPNQALIATDGWGGDQYVEYRKDDRECTKVGVRSDTPEDAQQLTAALAAWVAKSPATASTATEGDLVTLETCDPGADAKAVGGAASTDLLSLPSARIDAYLDAKQNGADAAQASCYGDAFVEKIPFADLTREYLQSAEGQQVISGLIAGCR